MILKVNPVMISTIPVAIQKILGFIVSRGSPRIYPNILSQVIKAVTNPNIMKYKPHLCQDLTLDLAFFIPTSSPIPISSPSDGFTCLGVKPDRYYGTNSLNLF